LPEAWTDSDLQQIAWAGHGFRPGLIKVTNDPARITATKLPGAISLMVPIPSAKVIVELVRQYPTARTVRVYTDPSISDNSQQV